MRDIIQTCFLNSSQSTAECHTRYLSRLRMAMSQCFLALVVFLWLARGAQGQHGPDVPKGAERGFDKPSSGPDIPRGADRGCDKPGPGPGASKGSDKSPGKAPDKGSSTEKENKGADARAKAAAKAGADATEHDKAAKAAKQTADAAAKHAEKARETQKELEKAAADAKKAADKAFQDALRDTQAKRNVTNAIEKELEMPNAWDKILNGLSDIVPGPWGTAKNVESTIEEFGKTEKDYYQDLVDKKERVDRMRAARPGKEADLDRAIKDAWDRADTARRARADAERREKPVREAIERFERLEREYRERQREFEKRAGASREHAQTLARELHDNRFAIGNAGLAVKGDTYRFSGTAEELATAGRKGLKLLLNAPFQFTDSAEWAWKRRSFLDQQLAHHLGYYLAGLSRNSPIIAGLFDTSKVTYVDAQRDPLAYNFAASDGGYGPAFGFCERHMKSGVPIPQTVRASYAALIRDVHAVVASQLLPFAPEEALQSPRDVALPRSMLMRVGRFPELPQGFRQPQLLIPSSDDANILGYPVDGDLFIVLPVPVLQDLLLVAAASQTTDGNDAMVAAVDRVVARGERDAELLLEVPAFAKRHGVDLESASVKDAFVATVAAIVLHELGHFYRHRLPPGASPLWNTDGAPRPFAFAELAALRGQSIPHAALMEHAVNALCEIEREADEAVARILWARNWAPPEKQPIILSEQALAVALLWAARRETRQLSLPRDHGQMRTHPYGHNRIESFRHVVEGLMGRHCTHRHLTFQTLGWHTSSEVLVSPGQIGRNILEDK